MNKFRLPAIWRLILSIAVCQLAGLVGSIFTTPTIPTWYASLNKPSFNPPNWLFGPVWIFLFVLMGVSLFLVWRERSDIPHVKPALLIFGLQLALNVLWSAVFFGLKSPIGGFIVIVVLWVAIFTTILRFRKVSELASILLIPYIVWVTFAGILNFAIFHLNR
ncbi:MAG: tryptophan-rich sensory protein [candidate division WOR-3 bacterium]|nr:MAG: tryptophan-rich sensory protein [candidate division WOR-3 bacterium]